MAAHPDDWMGHAEAGSILSRAGHSREAIAAFENALERNPDAVFVHRRLAWAYYFMGKRSPACDAAERALALAPDDHEAHAVMTLILLQYRATDEARKHAERALELAPERELAHWVHGLALAKSGRHRAAAEAYREVLRINPAHESMRGASMQAELRRNPLHRLHLVLWRLRTRPRAQIGWWFAWCCFAPWLAVMAVITVLIWVSWGNNTLTVLYLYRDRRRRPLVDSAIHYKIAGLTLGVGAAMLTTGAVLGDGRTAALALAVLSLVTPVLEPTTLDGAPRKYFMAVPFALAGWLAVLTPLVYTMPSGWAIPAAVLTCCAGLCSAWLSILLRRR
ncbi:hypothetical protein BJF79_26805 [Actinomadura sp. CNU-125]|nr:hypothetical protein BJF79_26805 [Actinomadura sp. CNU-125]